MDIQTTQLLDDASWLAHRYDEAADSFHFVQLARDKRRNLTFLDDEYIPADAERRIIPRTAIAKAMAPSAPLHFIFHSGFCCSTLLTRALEHSGTATGLSEPTILRDLVGFRQRGAQAEIFAIVFSAALSLLARPFTAEEAVVAKPSCTVNGLAKPLLSARQDSKAIFLYAPVRVFLGSIARKGITGRIWGRELFQVLHKSNRVDMGFTEEKLFGQTDLQIAGLAWLMQNLMIQALVDTGGDGRIRTLDSETFLARPADALFEIGQLFGLGIDRDTASNIANSDIFHTHSKFGGEFDAERREQDRGAEEAHADEIEKVAQWVETVAQGIDAPMSVSAPLLS